MSVLPSDLGSGNNSPEDDILAAIIALEELNMDVSSIKAGVRDMENGRYRPFNEFDADFRTRNQVG